MNLKTLSLIGALAFVGSASALPIIQGEIIFAGTYATDNSNLALATKFTSFSNVQTIGTSSGSYAGVPANFSPVTYNTFTFDPVAASLPIVPLWTLTVGSGPTAVTYSFDLTSLTIDTRSSTGIHLVGSGIAHVTGYEDTPGNWDLSIGTVGRFHFSAGTEVPDGGVTAILMGTGLLAVGLLRRKVS
jgi:hypothetical protein